MYSRKVDEWKKIVLTKLADGNGTVRSSKIYPSWMVFYEGEQIGKYVELRDKGVVHRPSKEKVIFWKYFFSELTIEEMHTYGPAMISRGWSVIEDEIRMWCADQKWEKIFSKSRNPWEWEQEQYKHQDLMLGKLYPFWDEKIIRDIKEKVATILQVQVQP